MLTRASLRRQEGSAIITALMVMLVMLPLGLALLSIVDTQAKYSGSERSRDRAFNLADSALSSAAFGLSRYSWPSSASSAPSNTGSTGTAAVCSSASYGATLGAATNAGSATARLQPNLNASYDDSAYTGATWQINVCDDDPAAAGPTVWKDALLNGWNYDRNGNGLVWVRSQATVAGRKRVLAALVKVSSIPALSSKYGLMTGHMNADVTNTLGTVLSGGGLLGNIASTLLGNDPLVAADSAAPSPASGVTAVRCGALDGCLTGAIGGAAALSAVNTLITGGKLVQTTSPTATSDAAIAQLKQQAVNSGTYVASTAGSVSSTSPPACTIPAGANANTVVYIDQVGTGTLGSTDGSAGDQFCLLDLTVAANQAFKALVIGNGRVVLRGNDTAVGKTFSGLVYGLNLQRTRLGDASPALREVIRIDKGAHVKGGVAADGKSAQVGVYPPPLCDPNALPLFALNCTLSGIVAMTGLLNTYNPAIQSNVALMNAVTIYDTAAVVPGTYHDIAGEAH